MPFYTGVGIDEKAEGFLSLVSFTITYSRLVLESYIQVRRFPFQPLLDIIVMAHKDDQQSSHRDRVSFQSHLRSIHVNIHFKLGGLREGTSLKCQLSCQDVL